MDVLNCILLMIELIDVNCRRSVNEKHDAYGERKNCSEFNALMKAQDYRRNVVVIKPTYQEVEVRVEDYCCRKKPEDIDLISEKSYLPQSHIKNCLFTALIIHFECNINGLTRYVTHLRNTSDQMHWSRCAATANQTWIKCFEFFFRIRQLKVKETNFKIQMIISSLDLIDQQEQPIRTL